ncbi:MAG: AsmA-like C-terminal region-containing protein [Chitinophagaceae bacterium]
MKFILKRFAKIFKITGIALGSILVLMFVLPILFPTYVNEKIKQWANHSITGELNFSKVRLSFFNHFPSLTVTLHDVVLKGSAPYKADTLIAAKEIALGVNLGSLFGKAVTIDEIYLTKGKLNILVNKEGKPNYNIYSADTSAKKSTDTTSASVKLSRIQIDDCILNYNDQSIPFVFTVNQFDYLGQGDLDKAVFDLTSKVKMDGLTVKYDNQAYLENKNIKARLITQINTNSLSFLFEDNDLRINQLPIDFKGKFDFLKNGYDMDLRFDTKETGFQNLFTALPPKFVAWVEKRKVQGKMIMTASLIGKYIVQENIVPSLTFDMKVTDGFFNSKKAKEPARNFLFDFHFKLPQLNTDSMMVDLDSVHLSVGDRFLQGAIHTKGLSKLFIDGHLQGELDIEKLNRVFGSPDSIDLKGMYHFNLSAKGLYAKGQNPLRIRPDTVITSIPSFSLQSSLRDGYMKYYSLPQPLKSVSFNLDAICKDNNYKNTSINLDNINAFALNNFIKGFVHVSSLQNFLIDADVKTKINLNEIKSFYPLDKIDLAGDLDADLTAKGNYNTAKKLFPVVNATINVKDGSVKTPYYPSPVNKIQMAIAIKSNSASLKDLQVKLTPVSLEFEGKPFTIRSDLSNFENINYSIASHGELDLGKIYKVFAIDGLDVNGSIKTDFTFQGSMSDVTSGNYSKLNNKGTLQLNNIRINSDMFPKPLLVQQGDFRVDNDKLSTDNLLLNYGNSKALLKGYFSNIINYALNDSSVLKGQLQLTSSFVNADELMAFSQVTDSSSRQTQDTAKGTGVILVPANLDMRFMANVDKLLYNGLNLTDCKGDISMRNGELILKNTGFKIIDAPVMMDASYKSLSADKAKFNYHISAKQFDVKKAYNEIPLFRQMASSAASAEGIVSLDYTLDGVLDKNMYPVLPSLKGGGTLSLEKVKMKGFKLFSAISKSANRDSLNNPDLSKVDIKSKIANNIMTIERTKMKVFGFRPRFEGQVSLDGKLNLKGRIGLPPFGIIGIPFTVTGTEDDPQVHLRKGKKGDELEEKDYDDDDLKDSQQAAPVNSPVKQ